MLTPCAVCRNTAWIWFGMNLLTSLSLPYIKFLQALQVLETFCRLSNTEMLLTLLPSALAFSQSTYVCTWWVTLRNVMRNVVTYPYHRYRTYVRHTVRHIQICSTQIDGRTTAFFGDGDGSWGRRCSGAIAAWILLTPNSYSYRPTANLTRATRASPAPAFDARASSAHWHEAKMHMRIPSIFITLSGI